jgi:hypothetical protein
MDEGELTETELTAIHRVELGLEWLHRAHGALVAFHHKTGHAMDHLASAEELFRESGHDELADRLRDEMLPRGVVPREDGGPGRWTYELLEAFEEDLYADARTFEAAARRAVTDGRRHAAERRQQTEWRRRAAGVDGPGSTDP